VSRTPARITQADVARAIRAAKQAGAGSVEIKPDGTILVLVSPKIASEAKKEEPPQVEPKKKVVL
jgi:hypothetical protein